MRSNQNRTSCLRMLDVHFRVLVTLALVLSPWPKLLGQAVPDRVNYQGILLQGDGTPVKPVPTDIEFRIYDTPAATTGLQWGRMFRINPDTNGTFNVVLSDEGSLLSGAPNVKLTSMFTSTGSDSRYLELTVSGSTPIRPRQQFVASPYAFLAHDVTQARQNFTVAGVLTVSGPAHLGSLVVGSTLATITNASIGGKLTVTNDTSIGGKLSVASDANLGGKLTVTNDTSIGGKLTVANDTLVVGKLTATNGSVSMLSRSGYAAPVAVFAQSGAHDWANAVRGTATTDGFIIVWWSSTTQTAKGNWIWHAMQVTIDGSTIEHMRSRYILDGDSAFNEDLTLRDTYTYPVAKGAVYSVDLKTDGGAKHVSDQVVKVYFIPFGKP